MTPVGIGGCRAAGNQRGFVLVATVWVLAALALLANYVDGVVSADRERARLAKAALQDDLDARGTEATLLYLLATGRTNHRGLLLPSAEESQPIRTDTPRRATALSGGARGGTPRRETALSGGARGGTPRRERPLSAGPPAARNMLSLAGEPYQGLGRVRFSLQDEAGLASANRRGPLYRAALLQAGVKPADIDRLMPRLQDYVDRDETLRISGAERAEYAAAGLPPPANWFLIAPLEVSKVLGARTLVQPQQWAFLRRNTSVAITPVVNYNTVPLELLTALLDGDAEAARRVAAHRQQHVLSSMAAVSAAAGVDLSVQGDVDGGMVVSRLRLALWREGDTQRTLIGIALTPNALDAPWRKEYRYLEPAHGGSEPARKPKTPLFQPT